MPQFKKVTVGFGIPAVGKVSGAWLPDQKEQNASWELYVEIITRVSVIELRGGTVLLREALSSLHSIFATTRSILKSYGPSVARPKAGQNLSFGYLAIVILNSVLRPFLSKWYPLLSSHEAARPGNVSPIDHEVSWEYYQNFRIELLQTQKVLIDYAEVLAEVAKVPLLIHRKDYQ